MSDEKSVITVEQYARDAWSYLTLMKRLYDDADKQLAVVPKPSPMRVLVDELVKAGDSLFYMKGKLQ